MKGDRYPERQEKMTGLCNDSLKDSNKQTGEPMSNAPDRSLLEALLDSWDRNNAILINLLRAIPKDAFGTRAMEGSPSVGELFGHIHFVRLVFITEDVPELAVDLPREEWVLPSLTEIAWRSF